MKDTHDSKRVEMTIQIPKGFVFQGDSTTGVRKHKKVLPNDPCPCGSTLKAKKCCFKTSKVIPSKD